MIQFITPRALFFVILPVLFILTACRQTATPIPPPQEQPEVSQTPISEVANGVPVTPVSLSQWQWERAEKGLPRQASIVLAVDAHPTDPNQIWAGYYAAGGLLTSPDNGQTWLTNQVGLADNPIFDLLPVTSTSEGSETVTLWAAARDGLFTSFDSGQTWQLVSGLPAVTAFALAADTEGRLYVGLDGEGIYAQTTDGGWVSVVPENSPLALAAVISLAVSDDGQYLYAGTSGQGIYASQDYGQRWQADFDGKYGSNVAVNPLNSQEAIVSLRDQVARTVDGGQSWQLITSLPLQFDEATSFLWLSDGTLGVGTSQGQLYRSLDSGVTWSQGGKGLPPGGVLDLGISIQPDGADRLLAATWNGLYASDDKGETWQNLAPALGTVSAQALLTFDDGLLLGTGAGLFRWQADDQQWQVATEATHSGGIQSLAIASANSQYIYAGSSGDGMVVSKDGGATWQHIAGTRLGASALAVDPRNADHIYKLAAWERVYESYDNGRTWLARWDGLGDVLETVSLTVDPVGSYIYVGTEDGLFRAEGTSPWNLTARDLSGQSILALLVQPPALGSTLYIGTTRGVYRSLDHGDTVEGMIDTTTDTVWGQGLENISVTALLIDPNQPETLYAGTAYHGVYQSIDGGQTWLPIGPTDLSDTVIEAMTWGPKNDLFIAATSGVWRGVIK